MSNICQNCGEPLEDNVVFCHNCGAKVESVKETKPEKQKKEKKKLSKGAKALLIVIPIAVVLIVAGVLVFMYIQTNNKKIGMINDAIAKAEQYAASEDYQKAISYLQDSLEDLKNDPEVLQKINEYRTKYREQVKKKALDSAATLVKQGNYAEAIKTLTKANKDIDNDADITNQIALYEVEYETSVLEEADRLIGEKNYDEAKSILATAKKTLPDNTKIAEKYNSLEDMKPVRLESLFVIDSSDNYSFENEKTFTDTFGNLYDCSHQYDCYYTNDIYYSEHNLGQSYEIFEGAIVMGTDADGSSKCAIRIYVDDELRYAQSDFMKNSGKIGFSVDVKNGTRLTIKIEKTETAQYHRSENCTVGIVDTMLYK